MTSTFLIPHWWQFTR